MTRDEAVKIMRHIWGGNPQHNLANNYVDAFVSLGMLKLDEPLVSRSSPEFKLYDAMFEHVPTLDFMPFKKLIDGAGLKILDLNAASEGTKI